MTRALQTPLLLALLGAAACAGGGGPEGFRAPADVGEALFTAQTFGGNGRTCATCHDLDRFGTIAPDFVRALFAEDRAAPLFQPIDSDDGTGASYERLLADATIRVSIPLDPDPATGLAVRRCDAPLEESVVLNRGIPTIYNTSLDGSLMVDGREGADLERQARNAVRAHYEATRDPTQEELVGIADFQRTLYSRGAVHRAFAFGAALSLPEGRTPSQIRGKNFLNPDRQCGICHSGALRNRTSSFHPDAIGHNFESALVGQEPDNPNPKHDWCYFDAARNEIVEGPLGTDRVFERPTADPGAAVLPGEKVYPSPADRLESMANHEFGARFGPVFKIPTLWGVASTAPYFHDNSAKTLAEVVDQYNFLFEHRPGLALAAGCDAARPECLDAQDRADIVAYLELLTFEGRGVRGAPPF